MNQNPLWIISRPNHNEVIIKQETAKIRMFFQFEIFLNFNVIQ